MAKVVRLYSRGQVTMAISRVWIEDGCFSCGVAESICPEVFLVVDENTVIKGVDLSKFEAKIKEAAESCPADVIKYE
jgi:ferredoxin